MTELLGENVRHQTLALYLKQKHIQSFGESNYREYTSRKISNNLLL